MTSSPKIFKTLLDKKGNRVYVVTWLGKKPNQILDYFASYHFQNDIKLTRYAKGAYTITIIK